MQEGMAGVKGLMEYKRGMGMDRQNMMRGKEGVEGMVYDAKMKMNKKKMMRGGKKKMRGALDTMKDDYGMPMEDCPECKAMGEMCDMHKKEMMMMDDDMEKGMGSGVLIMMK